MTTARQRLPAVASGCSAAYAGLARLYLGRVRGAGRREHFGAGRRAMMRRRRLQGRLRGIRTGIPREDAARRRRSRSPLRSPWPAAAHVTTARAPRSVRAARGIIGTGAELPAATSPAEHAFRCRRQPPVLVALVACLMRTPPAAGTAHRGALLMPAL